MLSKSNLLLLDEPTKHLYIESKEILEEALNNYTGTVLFVSHDRYFIQKTATKILDLTGNALLSYDGDYVWYLEKKETVEKLHLNPQVSGQTGDKPESDAKLDWKEQKEREAKRRKIENSYNKTEEEIHTIEQRLSLIDDTMSLPEYATDVGKLTELAKEKEQLDRDLEIAMEAWETYAEQLEQLA